MYDILCSCNQCTFENIKYFVQDIGDQVFSILHCILKAFPSSTSHIIQQSVNIITCRRHSMDLVSPIIDGSVFLNSSLNGFGTTIYDVFYPLCLW